jgi:Alpha amylase, catalytic domain/Domain of unknown function (DUF6429)
MSDPPWWQRAVIYEIYPRSFQDGDGDGVGDLAGILQRLDYLSWLSVDAVWICPIYPSPMADFGYDVADYVGIDSLFGMMADFDRLAAALHARGIRLIVDFVPNHTSDQHPKFKGNPPAGAAANSVDMGDQGGIGIERMEIDEDKVDDAVLALLRLTLHDGQRAWKGFDWDTLDRLYRKGLIGDPVNKAKSVVLTDEGLRRSEALVAALFGKARDA